MQDPQTWPSATFCTWPERLPSALSNATLSSRRWTFEPRTIVKKQSNAASDAKAAAEVSQVYDATDADIPSTRLPIPLLQTQTSRPT